MVVANESDFLSIRQAADYLRVSRATIWRWIDASKLKAYRIGKRTVRIKKSDIDSMIQPVRPGPSDDEPLRVYDGTKEDIWADYDPREAVEAFDKYAGSWSDIDAEEAKSFLRRAREEGSRPADRPRWPSS